MLNDIQRAAVRQWYHREAIRDEADRLIQAQDYEGLEEFIQMRALFPLSRHGELPDYLKAGEGPLIPNNCNPRDDVEEWRDAVEVGWAVVQEIFGLSRDDVHLRIKGWQEQSWEAFMRTVDERMKNRNPSPE